MSFNSGKIQRFGSSRSKQGCLTCIQRHLRCDESKPSCRRCERGNHPCQWRNSHPRGVTPLRIVQYSYVLSQWPDSNLREQRALQHFRVRTARELVGSSLHHHVWSKHVVQLAVTDVSIRHAVVAVASLHELYEAGLQDDKSATAFSLEQYGKAINGVIHRTHADMWSSTDGPLLICVLFGAYESLAFHLHSAISHISSGIRLLAERQSRNIDATAGCNISHDILYPIFTRFDSQTLALTVALDSTVFEGRFSQYSLLHQNSAAHGISDLQAIFDITLNHVVHELQSTSTARDAFETHRTLAAYSKWRRDFDAHTTSQVCFSREDIDVVMILQIWRLVLDILLHVDLRDGEMDFDFFIAEFKMVVDLCETFTGFADSEYIPSDDAKVRVTRLSSSGCRNNTDSPGKVNKRSGTWGIDPANTPLTERGMYDQAHVRKVTAKIQDVARGVRPSHQKLQKRSTPKPSFCLGESIVNPLFVVIGRCRDPPTRRRALALMQRCNRREGLWDSRLAFRLGGRIVDIEESGARHLLPDLAITNPPIAIAEAAQIPNEARVRQIQPVFLPERQSRERFYFAVSSKLHSADTNGEAWVEESMFW